MSANSRDILQDTEWKSASSDSHDASVGDNTTGGGAMHWMLLAGAAVTIGLFSKSVLDAAREEHIISRLQSPWKTACIAALKTNSEAPFPTPRIVLVNSSSRSTKALQRALRFFAGDVVLENRPRVRLYANCDAVRDPISLETAVFYAKAEVLEAHEQLTTPVPPSGASVAPTVAVAVREYVWVDGNLPDLFVSKDTLVQRRGGKASMVCAYVVAWTINGVVAETMTHTVEGTLADTDDMPSSYAAPTEATNLDEHSFDALNPLLRMSAESIESYLGKLSVASSPSSVAFVPTSSYHRHTRFRCDPLMVEFVLRLRYRLLQRQSISSSSSSMNIGNSGFIASIGRWSRHWASWSAKCLFPATADTQAAVSPASVATSEPFCVVLSRRDVPGVHVVARCESFTAAVARFRQAVATLIREKHHRRNRAASVVVDDSSVTSRTAVVLDAINSGASTAEDISAIVRLEYQALNYDLSAVASHQTPPHPFIPACDSEARDISLHASSCWMLWRNATTADSSEVDPVESDGGLSSWVKAEPGASVESLFGTSLSSGSKIHIRRVLYEYCVQITAFQDCEEYANLTCPLKEMGGGEPDADGRE